MYDTWVQVLYCGGDIKSNVQSQGVHPLDSSGATVQWPEIWRVLCVAEILEIRKGGLEPPEGWDLNELEDI